MDRYPGGERRSCAPAAFGVLLFTLVFVTSASGSNNELLLLQLPKERQRTPSLLSVSSVLEHKLALGYRVDAGISYESTETKVPLTVKLAEAKEAVASGDRFVHVGESPMLVVTMLLNDEAESSDRFGGHFAPSGNLYQPWIAKLLNNTAHHVRRHGHSLAVRMRRTLPAPAWQKPSSSDEEKRRKNFRENANWEKFQLLLDYLKRSPRNFSKVLYLDLDATPMNPDPMHDTVSAMAGEMDRRGVSLLMTDEDWRGVLGTGKGKTNGGIMMMKNTDFSRNFLETILAARFDEGEQPLGDGHLQTCRGNDQVCLQTILDNQEKALTPGGAEVLKAGWANRHFPHLQEQVAVLSGMKWNRHVCTYAERPCYPTINPKHMADYPPIFHVNRGLNDTDLEILHFMGGMKESQVKSALPDLQPEVA